MCGGLCVRMERNNGKRKQGRWNDLFIEGKWREYFEIGMFCLIGVWKGWWKGSGSQQGSVNFVEMEEVEIVQVEFYGGEPEKIYDLEQWNQSRRNEL